MKDIVIIEHNDKILSNIEILCQQMNFNVICIKQNKLDPTLIRNKVVILNGLYMPIYEHILNYSIVIIYGVKPVHHTNNNYIYLSYDNLIPTLYKLFNYLNLQTIHNNAQKLYSISITQFLLQKLQSKEQDLMANNSLIFDVYHKTYSMIENSLYTLLSISWINKRSTVLSMLKYIKQELVLNNNIIQNIKNINICKYQSIYYFSINYINKSSLYIL